MHAPDKLKYFKLDQDEALAARAVTPMEPTLLTVKYHCVIASFCGTSRERNLPPTSKFRSVVQCFSEWARAMAPRSYMPQTDITMTDHHQHQSLIQTAVIVAWQYSQLRTRTCSLAQCLNDIAMARLPDAPMGLSEQNTTCSVSTTCDTVQHDLHPTLVHGCATYIPRSHVAAMCKP